MNRSNYLKILALLMLCGVIDAELATNMAEDETVCMSLDSACSWLVDSLGIDVSQSSNAIEPSDGPSRQAPSVDPFTQPPDWFVMAYLKWAALQGALNSGV